MSTSFGRPSFHGGRNKCTTARRAATQSDELSSLCQAQSGEVARLVREQLDHQMAELIARIGAS